METRQCSICYQEVKGNADRRLLLATQENKKAFRDKLLSEGRDEAERSVESFLDPEVNGTVATRKNNTRFRSSKHGLRYRFAHSK